MKKLWVFLTFILLVAGCKDQETEYIGLKNFSTPQQEWLLQAEKDKCKNKYATKVNNAVLEMDQAFDEMLLGSSLTYEITIKTEETDKTPETDIHRGKVKLIDRVGDDMLLYVYDVNNDGSDEIVDEEKNKFVIYSKSTNKKHIDYDFVSFCQGNTISVGTIDESNSQLGKSLAFKYKNDSSVNNITKTHHALYNYPYFFSLYQYDEIHKVSDTKTKTLTRRLTISDSTKLGCAALSTKIDNDHICDARTEDGLTGMNGDSTCSVDTNEPFITSVKNRILSKANCI